MRLMPTLPLRMLSRKTARREARGHGERAAFAARVVVLEKGAAAAPSARPLAGHPAGSKSHRPGAGLGEARHPEPPPQPPPHPWWAGPAGKR